jgi:hypothetical protein
VGGDACEWTVVLNKAGTYEYQAVLLDYIHNKTAGRFPLTRSSAPDDAGAAGGL